MLRMMILGRMHAWMAGGDPSLLGGGGGGGGATDFRDSLPDDLKSDPSLADIKTVDDLAKSYIHAQKMIGSDKIVLPNDKSTPEQWGEFFDKTGRPTAAENYDVSEVKGKGILSDPGIDETTKKFHEIGLTDRQSRELLGFYQNQVDGQVTEIAAANETARVKARDTLMEKHGDDFDAKMDTAKSVLAKFGSDELNKTLEETGLGNEPALISALINIGEQILDDNPNDTGGDVLGIQNASAALREIETLKGDTEFMAAWGDESHIGHAAAVERWTEVHKKAHGTGEVAPA